jgi:phosphoribosyl 1,2-cyclic phosphate phosphodiesterase
MKITILGSGASSGVPLVGCSCEVCHSTDSRNQRSRVSCLVEVAGVALLIDTSPDLRTQCLKNRLHTVDAILYTHAHADHLHGIDDVRMLNHNRQSAIPAYADAPTLESISARFNYVFQPPIPEYGWFRPCLIPHKITPYQPFMAAGVEVHPFAQIHGRMHSLGFRIQDFAYSTDVKEFPAESEPYLRNLQLWVVDCLKWEAAHTHAHLELTLSWIARYQPERAILTHLSHEFDYERLCAQLPANVTAAFDGLVCQL